MKKEMKSIICYPENYEQKYINGSFGSVTPKGEISVNFFCEVLPIPKETKIVVSENKTEEIFIEDDSIASVKKIEAGIIMTLETAESIYHWLGKNIEVAKNTIEGEGA